MGKAEVGKAPVAFMLRAGDICVTSAEQAAEEDRQGIDHDMVNISVESGKQAEVVGSNGWELFSEGSLNYRAKLHPGRHWLAVGWLLIPRQLCSCLKIRQKVKLTAWFSCMSPQHPVEIPLSPPVTGVRAPWHPSLRNWRLKLETKIQATHGVLRYH